MATDFRKDIPSKNEGEGSKSAAKAYNKDQQDFVKSGKVDAAAQEARKAIDGAEKESLKAAELVIVVLPVARSATDVCKRQ